MLPECFLSGAVCVLCYGVGSTVGGSIVTAWPSEGSLHWLALSLLSAYVKHGLLNGYLLILSFFTFISWSSLKPRIKFFLSHRKAEWILNYSTSVPIFRRRSWCLRYLQRWQWFWCWLPHFSSSLWTWGVRAGVRIAGSCRRGSCSCSNCPSFRRCTSWSAWGSF